MLERRFRTFLTALVVVTAVPTMLACNGDEEGNGGNGPNGPGEAPAFVGSWDAATFVVNGVDLIAGGTFANFFFTEDSYNVAATDDTSGILCDPGPNCNESGDLSYTATTMTFDPGEAESVTLNWEVNGDVLTITGSIEGNTLTATLDKL